MSVAVRFARPDDVPVLTELMDDYIFGFYKNPRPPASKLHALIHSLLDRQQGVQLVVLDQDQAVGFATLYFTYSTMKADRIAVLNDFFMKEAYRDTEWESQLFLACKRYVQEQGFANMTWITSIQNTRAQTFFRRMDAVQGKDWVHFSLF